MKCLTFFYGMKVATIQPRSGSKTILNDGNYYFTKC